MKFETLVSYSEKIVREAVRAFWWKKMGKELYWAIPFFIIGVTMIYASPINWYYGAFFSLVCVVAIAAIFIGYLAYLKSSLSLFREMGEEQCSWTFDNEGFYVKSNIGETKLKWAVLKEIMKFQKFWLLVYKNGAYSTLPIAGITQEQMEFIETSHNKANSTDAPKARAAD